MDGVLDVEKCIRLVEPIVDYGVTTVHTPVDGDPASITQMWWSVSDLRHAVRMSPAVDIFECMFEYEEMASTSDTTVEHVRELQARIREMQTTKLDSRLMPTHPVIGALLPGGGILQGSAYSIDGSVALVMALLAAPSAAGSWCGVVGMPEFGIEAAAGFGIDLERLVLVPHPGDQWLAVTAAIADVMSIVVTRPPARTSDQSVARLAARLRQRGTTLIVLGPWPQTEAMLSLSHSDWSGIGDGYGYLSARQATITVTSRAHGRPRSARVWLPEISHPLTQQTAAHIERSVIQPSAIERSAELEVAV